jgi:hypothetical protein
MLQFLRKYLRFITGRFRIIYMYIYICYGVHSFRKFKPYHCNKVLHMTIASNQGLQSIGELEQFIS